jgi:hypothetical protein
MNYQNAYRNLLIAVAKRIVALDENRENIQHRKDTAASAVQHAYYKGARNTNGHLHKDLTYNLGKNSKACKKLFGTADYRDIAKHEFLDDATAHQLDIARNSLRNL